MIVVAVANNKGGTGKTTTARTLADYFAMGGYRTLMIDADPQRSLTKLCGVNAVKYPLESVMGGASPGTVSITQAAVAVKDNLDLIGGGEWLLQREQEMVNRFNRESIMRKAMAKANGRYDFALIDCPPSIGLLTVNALVASDAAVVPLQPSVQDLWGLSQFMTSAIIPLIREVNPKLRVIGVVPTMLDERRVHDRGVVKALKEAGYPVLQAIGSTVRIREAAAVHETILTFAPEHDQAKNYAELGRQIERWAANKDEQRKQ